MDYHVSESILYCHVWVCLTVVEELGHFILCILYDFPLFGYKGVKSDKHGVIHHLHVIEECADDMQMCCLLLGQKE